MLKIGAVRWRGKCSRHPTFDPFDGGRDAVKGECPRCTNLVEILEMHQRMLALMRTFMPPPVKRRPKQGPLNQNNLQIGLFEEVR